MVSGRGRWAVAIACMPLMLLAGCPQRPAGAPGGIAANATAPAITAPAPVTTPAPAMTQAQAIDLATRAQRVRQLLQQAEGDYSSGVANYRAGRLEAARSDFDMAVDLMLTSDLDVKNDSQLADEFDHLLNAINTLEMSALKEGTGFSAPIEAAPLDAADQVTFGTNAALTAKVEEELKTTQSDFPLVVNDYVAGFINYFSNSKAGHASLLRSLERAGKYKEMISKDLRDEGVPQDLIYLAVAESGFQPRVVNAQSGAGGMWQFMPFQGVYGLTRNGYYDERFDPEKSSIAYAKYMKMLYNQFGDWYLAMAAYNWGPGNVQRAVMRTGYADFWELYRRNSLPQATKNYVPGIIAAIIVAKNPQQYGLEDMVPDAPVLSDTVTVDYAVDLRLVADVTGASLPEMVALNPSLLHTSTPRDGEFDLHLPVGTSDVYQKRIAKIPEDKRGSWRFHVVHAGDSLDSIASILHGRPAEIAAANGLNANAVTDAGDELVIPVANTVAAAHPLHYTTRAGDTLVKVADRFNVSVEDLRRWNHLSSSKIRPQRTLAVSEPVRLGPATHARVKKSHAGAGTRAGASTTTGAGTHGKVSAKARGSATTKSAAKSAANTVKPSAKRTSQSATKKKKVAAKKHGTTK